MAISLAGKVSGELCTNTARVSMLASDTTPNDSDPAAVHNALGAVHERNTLSKVKLSLGNGLAALDL